MMDKLDINKKFKLTSEEMRLLYLIAKGWSYDEISELFHISDKDVAESMADIIKKVHQANKREV